LVYLTNQQKDGEEAKFINRLDS